MCALVPFFKHRWDAVFPMPSPWTVSVMPPAPAWSPEEETKCPQSQEEEEQQDQKTEEPKSKSEWVVEGHSVSVSIIGIGHWSRFTRGCFNGDRRALRHTRPKGEERDAGDRGDEHQR